MAGRSIIRCSNVLCWLCAWAACCTSQRALAFGGVWASTGASIEQTAMRAIIVRGPEREVTAIVQLTTAGDAERFSWLVPVPGEARVSASSNAVFARLEAATAPQYWVEQAGLLECADGAASAMPSGSTEITSVTEPTTTLARGAIGPYEYVDLTVDAAVSDAESLRGWLDARGFAATSGDTDRLAAYLKDGWHVLAFERKRDVSARDLRPVMLRYKSDALALPLTAGALGADADMPVQLWIFGPSQAVPESYPSLVLNDARIDWLSAGRYLAGALPSGGGGLLAEYVPKPRNYTELVTAAAREASGRGFVTELADAASDYRDKIWTASDEGTFETLSTQSYADGLDALVQLRSNYAGWDGLYESVSGASALPEGMTVEQLMSDPEAGRGRVHIDADKLFALARDNVIAPMRDAADTLRQAPYMTRLFTTLGANARGVDPSFVFNFDLSQIRGVHVARQQLACSADVAVRDAAWRMQLPQGGVVSGSGTDWPDASAQPANLEVVKLGETGSGRVVQDNSEQLARVLLPDDDAPVTSAITLPPLAAVVIGGSQQLQRPALPEPELMKPPAASCSVTRVAPRSQARWGVLAGAALLLLLRRRRWLLHVLALSALTGCAAAEGAPTSQEAALTTVDMTLEQLRDPETCKGCHPTHYRQWSASMHAYAARDPVFLAMNKRGQRETGGQLGDFCVKCHAPMAVLDKRTTDGLNLDQLADKQRGVSCYFCHNIEQIEGDHNGLMKLANDSTMRGPIQNPIQPGVHGATYSELFDDRHRKSTEMCGGCHDIRTPNGVHLERTFEEYRAGLFSKVATGDTSEDASPFDTCAGCHMPGKEDVVALAPAGAPKRMLHEHLWPGVDLALTDFPGKDAMRSAVEDCQFGAASLSFLKLEVTPPDVFTFQLETNAGHNQPSGAAEDRRLWLEFAAYDDEGRLLPEASSGMIEDDALEEWPAGDPRHDPRLLMFRDHLFDAQGKEVHMFWEAAKSSAHPLGFESSALPVATTTYVEGKHALVKQYRASMAGGLPARVSARMRMRPIGNDVLRDLIASGDLDPAYASQVHTLDFGTQLEWTRQDGTQKLISATPKSDCTSYRCMLDPDSSDCR